MPKRLQAIRERTVDAARAVVERTSANPYHVSMKPRDYVWGSNGVAAGYGMYLLIANVFSPEPGFVDAARDNLALSAGTEYVFAFVGNAGWGKPISASASPAQRVGQAGRALAGDAFRRSRRRA